MEASKPDGNGVQHSELLLPLSIFSNGSSGLEAISHYMKENLNLRYCEIAALLNRDDRTIWGAYRSSRIKSDYEMAEDSSIKIPASIFRNRSLSVLESLSEYLKDELNLRYCSIASLLNKDQRTIWTVYRRAKRKRQQNAKA